MSQPHAKFEEGAIWWRGTNRTWTYLPRDDAERRRAQFDGCAQEHWFKERAEAFVRDLDAAISAYDEWEQSLVHA